MQGSYPVSSTTYVVNQAIGANYSAPQVPKEVYSGVFVQMVITGGTTPTGTLSFQVSADGISWSNLSVQGNAQTIAVSNNGVFNFNEWSVVSRFWRVNWAFTSGTGSPVLNCQYQMS
jgi:hypothetical protein